MNLLEIAALIDEGTQRLLGTPDKRDAFPLRPSSFGRCAREIALALGGAAARPMGAATLRLLNRGTQRDAALTQALTVALRGVVGGVSVSHPRLWTPLRTPPGWEAEQVAHALKRPDRVSVKGGELVCAGEADLVLFSAHERGVEPDVLIDFKSMGAYSFKKHRDGDVSEAYAIQLFAYAQGWALARRDRSFPFPRMVLVCEAADSDARHGMAAGELAVIELDHGEAKATYDAAMDRLRDVLAAFMEGRAELVPPSVGPPKGKTLPWNCNYCSLCPQQNGCWDTLGAAGELVNKGTATRPKWSLV